MQEDFELTLFDRLQGGCPYAIDIADELDKLESLLPDERKQCEAIWGKVYDEYRRLGYRLKSR